jgi:hypothetical protein
MLMKRLLRVVLLVTLQTALAFGDDEKPAIDPSEHRATIRQRLLEWTPLGASFSNVTTVLGEKFASPSSPRRSWAAEIMQREGRPEREIVNTAAEWEADPLQIRLKFPIAS